MQAASLDLRVPVWGIGSIMGLIRLQIVVHSLRNFGSCVLQRQKFLNGLPGTTGLIAPRFCARIEFETPLATNLARPGRQEVFSRNPSSASPSSASYINRSGGQRSHLTWWSAILPCVHSGRWARRSCS